jgi:hypothetical protein
VTDPTTTPETPDASASGEPGVPEQLRARYAAALRTPPLPCGLHRDPELHGIVTDGPSTFSLTPAELVAERARLLARGWTTADIAARFAQRQVTA